MRKIRVRTESKSYLIYFGSESLTYLKNQIKNSGSKALIICDSNVYKFHKYKIESLMNIGREVFLYRFTSSEKNKSTKSVENIYRFLLEKNFSRKDLLIAIGGGIVGDIAGFVASTYMRGISYFQIPTTLLSMVDSSVGGKTGVNFSGIKNLVGTFYQPEAVYIDLQFLNTLPKREIVSGAGEIFKYAFLSDETSYEFVRESLQDIVCEKKFNEAMVSHCLNIKSAIVERDEKETSGIRKILNLGHTFAHAFESALNFNIKHGEAVIAGVVASLITSKNLELISDKQLNKYLTDFKFLPVNRKIFYVDKNDLLKKMKSDKKSSDGRINLVLIRKPGEVLIDVPVGGNIIIDSFKELSELDGRFKKKTVGW